MREFYVRGRRFRLGPKALLGEGGEAEVYGLDARRAVKLWKGPDHPDFAPFAAAAKAAEERVALYRAKLSAMLSSLPSSLPPSVVRPLDVALDEPRNGQVMGFSMERVRDTVPLTELTDPRRRQGVDPGLVKARLLDLEAALRGIHAAGAVIGDLNDRNVLVGEDRVRIIDVDSFGLPGFPATAYTLRTLDPLLCDPSALVPVPIRPLGSDSDWYAFAVLAFWCLLLVDPYGGVYRPKRPEDRCRPEARPARRITVFHPEVVLPKAALPLETLPDGLLDAFHRTFVRDHRGAFPRPLLEALRFELCPSCGRPIARAACPSCQGTAGHLVGAALAAAATAKATAAATSAAAAMPAVVRGRVTVTSLARTRGVFLAAEWQGDHLAFLEYEEGLFRREDGRVVLTGALHPRLGFGLRGAETWIGAPGRLLGLAPDGSHRVLTVDQGRDGPAFACAGDALAWAEGGRLQVEKGSRRAVSGRGPSATTRSLARGPRVVGEILPRLGAFWLGPGFGLGFYRAGGLSVCYVFHPEHGLFHDGVELGPLPGSLTRAHAALSERLGWMVLGLASQGRERLVAWAMTPHGQVVGRLERDPDDADDEEAASWLLALPGAAAVGNALFVPTDEGIARVEVVGGQICRTRTFVDTEPFVDRASTLTPVPGGLAVISSQEIRRVTLA